MHVLQDLKRIKIPLPPITEQRKIAGILIKLDDAIQKIQENINKTKELKKMLINKFFNGGLKTAVPNKPKTRLLYETQVSE
jgi:type I restriction enzyme S subunit